MFDDTFTQNLEKKLEIYCDLQEMWQFFGILIQKILTFLISTSC